MSATFTQQTIAEAYDAAIAALEPQRDAAVEAGEIGHAGIATQAIDDLRTRQAQHRAAALLTSWTGRRAAKALADAGIDTDVVDDDAIVTLPDGATLRVVPIARRAPEQGYDVVIRAADGAALSRHRAGDHPALIALVQALVGSAVPA